MWLLFLVLLLAPGKGTDASRVSGTTQESEVRSGLPAALSGWSGRSTGSLLVVGGRNDPQVAAILKLCEAQSAAGRPRCSELFRYIANCIKIHGSQCLRCTYSTVKDISAQKSCCTAVRDAKAYAIQHCQVVAGPGWQLDRSQEAQPCPPGSVKAGAGNQKCAKCAGRTYQPSRRQRACKACPIGKRVNAAHTKCISYGPGVQPGRNGAPEKCPPGTAKSGSGDFRCGRCTGTLRDGCQRYSAEAGQSQCSLCPHGFRVNAGRTLCSPPPPLPSPPPPPAPFSVLVVGGNLDNPGPPTAELQRSSAPASWDGAIPQPPPNYREGAALVKLGNGLVLWAGGGDPWTRYSTSEVYNPATGTWSATGPFMADSRVGLTLLALSDGGSALACGGMDGSTSASNMLLGLNTCEVYNSTSNTWAAAPSMINKRINHGSVLYQGHPLHCNGYSPQCFNVTFGCELFNQTTQQYDAFPNIPYTQPLDTEFVTFQLVVLTSGTLVATLWDGQDASSPTWVFKAGAADWVAAPLQTPVVYARTLTACNGGASAFLTGGQLDGSTAVKTVQVLNEDTLVWDATYPPLLVGRNRHSAASLPDGSCLIFGGFDGSGEEVNTAERLHMGAAAWVNAGTMANHRTGGFGNQRLAVVLP